MEEHLFIRHLEFEFVIPQHWLFDNLVVMEENVPLRGWPIL